MESSSKKVTKKETATKKTVADRIWDEIKGLETNMWALPNQPISKYATKMDLDPDKLYIKPAISSAKSVLESMLRHKYNVEDAREYLILTLKK